MRLHHEETGPPDGTPVVLVHGWPQDGACWRRVVARLGDGHRCIVPDLRGHGRSPSASDGYAKERMADDVLELLDELGLARVGYAGHDWGAFIGFLLALRAPERLTGLLALSVPHPWPSSRDRLDPRRLAGFAYQLPLATPLLGRTLMRAGLTRRLLRAGTPRGTLSDADLAHYERAMGSARGAATTESMYRTFLLREVPAIAAGRYARARLTVPTRLVVGERDLIVRGADLRGFEDHAVDMTVEWVPGAGHFLPEERPGLVARRIRELFPARARVAMR